MASFPIEIKSFLSDRAFIIEAMCFNLGEEPIRVFKQGLRQD